MANFVESLFQSVLFDMVIKEAQTAVTGTLGTELNSLLTKYVQVHQFGKQIGFDFSLTQMPVNQNETLFVDFNGTWYTAGQSNQDKTYSGLQVPRLANEVIKNTLPYDVSAAIRKETVESLFALL